LSHGLLVQLSRKSQAYCKRTRLEFHRLPEVKPKSLWTKGLYVSTSDLPLTDKQARKVWLKEYGHVLVYKLADKDGGITYLATNDLNLTDYDDFTADFNHRWKIEEFHRGLKQTTGIEKCYVARATAQKTHIFVTFTAFVRLETTRLKEHISWYEQKAIISRNATTAYLFNFA